MMAMFHGMCSHVLCHKYYEEFHVRWADQETTSDASSRQRVLFWKRELEGTKTSFTTNGLCMSSG